MVNVYGQTGLVPSGTLHANSEVRTRRYAVLSTNAVAIFLGDVVKLVTTGGGTATGLPCVNGMSSASADMVGVVVGIFDSTGKPMIHPTYHLAASTAGYVMVADDPDSEFMVRVNDPDYGVTYLTDSSIGDEADLIFGAGNTKTGNSGFELSTTMKGVGQQGMFRIERLAPLPGNTWAPNAMVIISFAEHLRKAARVAV